MRCNAELRAISSFADISLEREKERERELFALLSLSFCCRVVVSVVFISYLSYQLHCCTLPDKRCLSHGMLPLSGHDDVALFK